MPMNRPEETNEAPRIAVGETVTWTSQSGSYSKEKTGEVLAFVPAWASARAFAPQAFQEGQRSRRQFDGSSSAVDRYIVEVPRTGAKGRKLASYFYAPLASVVEKQNKKVRREGEPRTLSASPPDMVRGWERLEAAGYVTPHRETLRLLEPWFEFEEGTIFTDAKEVPEDGAPHLDKGMRFFLVARITKEAETAPDGTRNMAEVTMTVVSTKQAEVVA